MFHKGKECGETCQNMYTLDGGSPPCSECYPNPLPANREAVRVYGLVSHQVRVAGMGEIIGLDYSAVFPVMELCGVQDKLDCLARMEVIFQEIQEMRADK